ncbi:hypothetical protein DPX16_22867 [Anabarilius grahami]|uniref:Uncharacterized protein n=1 Tax=Anabarilius grahami TaxID=495550 RepID=A0A3N0Y4I1_ANAGA|nr:hypothetical protein DPX16_22867 [Anabarilius grahami]
METVCEERDPGLHGFVEAVCADRRNRFCVTPPNIRTCFSETGEEETEIVGLVNGAGRGIQESVTSSDPSASALLASTQEEQDVAVEDDVVSESSWPACPAYDELLEVMSRATDRLDLPWRRERCELSTLNRPALVSLPFLPSLHAEVERFRFDERQWCLRGRYPFHTTTQSIPPGKEGMSGGKMDGGEERGGQEKRGKGRVVEERGMTHPL